MTTEGGSESRVRFAVLCPDCVWFMPSVEPYNSGRDSNAALWLTYAPLRTAESVVRSWWANGATPTAPSGRAAT